MGTLVVLAFYLLVGLLDSIHFHPSSQTEDGQQAESAEVISLFDWLVTPLRVRQEKTYSAPLATRLYAKESVELADGRMARIYPRLQFGGAHLQDPDQEWGRDILRLSLFGILKGVLVTLVLSNILIALLAGKAEVCRPDTNCASTLEGLENIDAWLAPGPWTVIHFNWGLWDLCYRNPQSKTQGRRDKVNGTLTHTPEQYRENLERAAPITPDEPLTYRFALPTANHVFLPGHRIMVQVQSSWFPLYDRNPQTFVPSIFWAKPEDFRKATQRIYHSRDAASYVELPLVVTDAIQGDS